MDKFFLKVLHEEPLDELMLNELKGGKSCTCDNGSFFSCKCNNIHTCDCDTGSTFHCDIFKPNREDS